MNFNFGKYLKIELAVSGGRLYQRRMSIYSRSQRRIFYLQDRKMLKIKVNFGSPFSKYKSPFMNIAR